MAVVDRDANPMRFRWRLHNPFMPFAVEEVAFYHKVPLRLKWKAKLRPSPRSFQEWGVVFSLCCSDEEEDDGFIVVADRIEIKIDTDEFVFQLNYDYGPVFNEDNDHTFESREISFPPHSTRVEVDVILFFRERYCERMYLEQFSGDLEKLLFERNYSDFRLDALHAHECILRARWPSLFRRHPREAVEGGTVETGLPEDVLRYFLTYMYTGESRPVDMEEREENVETEMRGAIEEYGLSRIARVLSDRPPAFHQFETTRSILTFNCIFYLNYDKIIESEKLLEPSLQMNSKLTFSLNRQIPFLRYEFRFTNEVVLYVRLIGKYREGLMEETLFETDKVVDPDLNLISGGVPLAGYTPEVEVFMDKCQRGESLQDVERTLVFYIMMTQGRRTSEPEILESSEPVEDDYELKLLSDDFLRLRDTPRLWYDLEVLTPEGDRRFLLHRAFIAARVPNWRAVLTPIDYEGNPVPVEDLVPDRIRCHLSTDALIHIGDYIYSGQVFPLNAKDRDDVFDFAYASGMYDLVGMSMMCDRFD